MCNCDYCRQEYQKHFLPKDTWWAERIRKEDEDKRNAERPKPRAKP